MVNNITIRNLNVRGLRDKKRRKETFNLFKQDKNDIILLQETHSQDEDINLWSKEWNGPVIFAHGSSNSKGVCILINKNSQVICNTSYVDPEGRFIIIEVNYANKLFHVVILNTPNTDCPDFSVNIFRELANVNVSDLILCGDYNLVLQPNIDRSENVRYKPNAYERLMELSEQLDMIDVWRCKNPEEKSFSWKRIKDGKLSGGHIDFALTTLGIANRIEKICYEPGYKTDHSMIHIKLLFEENSRGPGY